MKSIFTDHLDICHISGDMTDVCVHHIFYGNKCRRVAERYGYVIPITPEIHRQIHSQPGWGLDLALKRRCQEDFEAHHGSRAEFIELFEKSYL